MKHTELRGEVRVRTIDFRCSPDVRQQRRELTWHMISIPVLRADRRGYEA